LRRLFWYKANAAAFPSTRQSATTRDIQAPPYFVVFDSAPEPFRVSRCSAQRESIGRGAGGDMIYLIDSQQEEKRPSPSRRNFLKGIGAAALASTIPLKAFSAAGPGEGKT